MCVFAGRLGGQLGTGEAFCFPNWKESRVPEPAVHVSAGDAHSAAVGFSGALYTWGGNTKGAECARRKARVVLVCACVSFTASL